MLRSSRITKRKLIKLEINDLLLRRALPEHFPRCRMDGDNAVVLANAGDRLFEMNLLPSNSIRQQFADLLRSSLYRSAQWKHFNIFLYHQVICKYTLTRSS